MDTIQQIYCTCANFGAYENVLEANASCIQEAHTHTHKDDAENEIILYKACA